MEWQPIDTAPRDGTVCDILSYGKIWRGDNLINFQLRHTDMSYEGKLGRWQNQYKTAYVLDDVVTHWMPLPEPPE